MMMPEDDEILKNGTVDFSRIRKVSFYWYKKSLNPAEKNYKKIQTESPFGE